MDKFSLEAWRHYPESRVCPNMKMPDDNERFEERCLPHGFGGCGIILRLSDTAEITEKTKQGIRFGLLLDAADGIICIRESLARWGLQRVWETAPVLLKAQDAPDDISAIAHAAAGWHVAAADMHIPGLMPARMALRRLTFPKKLSGGGAIPLRFWWQNIGDAPLYVGSQTKLWLRSGGKITEIPIHDEKPMRKIGDYTHNEIAKLPELPAGDYELLCGIFDSQGKPLPLAIESPQIDGKHLLGIITLDDEPRPELFNAWDDYYPDGYYPTEDPKLPV